jgi:hypothetical protein
MSFVLYRPGQILRESVSEIEIHGLRTTGNKNEKELTYLAKWVSELLNEMRRYYRHKKR